MKRLLLLLFIIVFLSLLYTTGLTVETFDIPSPDTGQPIPAETPPKVTCVTPKQGRLPIYNELYRLREAIDNINERLDQQDSVVASLRDSDNMPTTEE